VRSIAIQVFAVAVVVGALTCLTGWFNYRSGFNVLWMLGVPIAVAVLANEDIGARTLAGLWLTLWSWLVVSAIGVVVVGY
jgi:hypothetical protein